MFCIFNHTFKIIKQKKFYKGRQPHTYLPYSHLTHCSLKPVLVLKFSVCPSALVPWGVDTFVNPMRPGSWPARGGSQRDSTFSWVRSELPRESKQCLLLEFCLFFPEVDPILVPMLPLLQPWAKLPRVELVGSLESESTIFRQALMWPRQILSQPWWTPLDPWELGWDSLNKIWGEKNMKWYFPSFLLYHVFHIFVSSFIRL